MKWNPKAMDTSIQKDLNCSRDYPRAISMLSFFITEKRENAKIFLCRK